MITKGEGRTRVWLDKRNVGEDLVYVVGGGEREHVGAIVFCEPGREPQVIRSGTHKDHIVLVPLAQAACDKYQRKVVVAGGIHVDDITKEEIETIIQNCKELESDL